jgi:hypothetical protein
VLPTLVSASSVEEGENEDGAAAVEIIDADLLFPAPLLVAVAAVVAMDMVVALDVLVPGGVSTGDCLSEPSEMETALDPPQPHMKPRPFLLMRSPPPAPRRRSIIAFIDREAESLGSVASVRCERAGRGGCGGVKSWWCSGVRRKMRKSVVYITRKPAASQSQTAILVFAIRSW